MITVTELYIYPVKSCGGILLDSANISKSGFELDRLWVVTTPDHKILTARTHPKLVTAKQRIEILEGKKLVYLSSDSMSRTLVLDPLSSDIGTEVEFSIWKDKAHGHDCGPEAASWFSELLQEDCRLLIKSSRPRPANNLYLERDGFGDLKPETTFTDFTSILVTSKESETQLRKELSEDLKVQISNLNFRPNIVIKGCSTPYEEDSFGVVNVGSTSLHFDQPCDRCILPNVNPENGIPHKTEPSKTMMKTRRSYPHIAEYNYFYGVFAIPLKEGSISIGDNLEVVTRTEK